ncbi:MAG: alpha/beta fold hydrolase [Acidimicrobiales bacterium]
MPFAKSGDLDIYYEVDAFSDEDPPLVLIAGLGAQLLFYEDELVRGLVDRAFRVVRFDNRDSGLSGSVDVEVDRAELYSRLEGDGAFEPPYGLDDMAGDVVAVLDDLEVEKAHVLGVSLGGMIAQAMAIGHPKRVHSLTLLSSTSGSSSVGQPSAEAMDALVRERPASQTRAEVIESDLADRRIWATPEHFDADLAREYFGRCFDRARNPAGMTRQMAAVVCAPDREPDLARLDVPTLVMHGTEDKLIAPDGGERLAELIPGSEFVGLDGMGHDLPPYYWAPVIESVTQLAIRAR